MDLPVDWELAGEIEAFGENLPLGHFLHLKIPKWPDLGSNAGRCGGSGDVVAVLWSSVSYVFASCADNK
jgi:hypothetical protein